MRELRMSGSVRGVPSNGHPYRDPQKRDPKNADSRWPAAWRIAGTTLAFLCEAIGMSVLDLPPGHDSCRTCRSMGGLWLFCDIGHGLAPKNVEISYSLASVIS